MPIPKGGRGKKAPYDTVVMRIPEELAPKVDLMVSQYREKVINGVDTHQGMTLKTVNEAMDLAKEILSKKKSARVSLRKLLQVLYNLVDEPEI